MQDTWHVVTGPAWTWPLLFSLQETSACIIQCFHNNRLLNTKGCSVPGGPQDLQGVRCSAWTIHREARALSSLCEKLDKPRN